MKIAAPALPISANRNLYEAIRELSWFTRTVLKGGTYYINSQFLTLQEVHVITNLVKAFKIPQTNLKVLKYSEQEMQGFPEKVEAGEIYAVKINCKDVNPYLDKLGDFSKERTASTLTLPEPQSGEVLTSYLSRLNPGIEAVSLTRWDPTVRVDIPARMLRTLSTADIYHIYATLKKLEAHPNISRVKPFQEGSFVIELTGVKSGKSVIL